MESLIENKNNILHNWENNSEFIEELSSEELFQIIITFINDEEIAELINKNFMKIINRCSMDYDMINYFTILILKFSKNKKYQEICNIMIDTTVRNVFSNATLIFLMKHFKRIQVEKQYNKEEIYTTMLNELSEMDTKKSSIILFDLFIFPDFKLMLEKRHRTIATLIECYQLWGPDVVSSTMFNGSSIIGKLLQGENEKIAAKYLRDMLEEKQISTRNIQMIGGGSNSLVYKIKDSVIKFGETRNNRRIYIYHRILASQIRKLELSTTGEELFYVETMRNAIVGNVTEEERDELKKDLYNHGLIWEDAKLENCGLLPDGYDNNCDLPVDYVEVAGRIEAPHDREEFMKRQRKVVVIDNDFIRLNPLKLGR